MYFDTTAKRQTVRNVILADAHPLVRFAIRNLIEGRGFSVKAEGQNLTDVYDKVQEAGSEILVFDPQDEPCGWLGLLDSLLAIHPELNVVILARKISDEEVISALELGVRCIINKNARPPELVSAMAAIRAGNYWVPGLGEVRNVQNTIKRFKDKIKGKAPKPAFGLTRRELEVTALIVEGFSNKEIGKQFRIAEDTVKRHLWNIFNKTGVATRLELAMFAIAHKLTKVQTESSTFAEAA